MNSLEIEINKLLEGDCDIKGTLSRIDREYVNDFENLHSWTDSRWVSYERRFCEDSDKIRELIPVELEEARDWSTMVRSVTEKGFLQTFEQSDCQNRQKTLRALLVILYHLVALDSLYFQIYSEKKLPTWVMKLSEQL